MDAPLKMFLVVLFLLNVVFVLLAISLCCCHDCCFLLVDVEVKDDKVEVRNSVVHGLVVDALFDVNAVGFLSDHDIDFVIEIIENDDQKKIFISNLSMSMGLTSMIHHSSSR